MLWFYEWFFPVIWIIFFLYWRIRAFNTKTTQRIEPLASRILRTFLCLVAVALLLIPPKYVPFPWLYHQLWPTGLWPFCAGSRHQHRRPPVRRLGAHTPRPQLEQLRHH